MRRAIKPTASERRGLNAALHGLAHELKPRGIGLLLLQPRLGTHPHGRLLRIHRPRGERLRHSLPRGSPRAAPVRRPLPLPWNSDALVTGAVRYVQTPGPETTVNMSYSTRTFILAPDDTLYRLASAKFSRMVDDPESHRLTRFAGQRVRMAEAIVEVRDRAPCAVVRIIYEMLGFDAEGRLDRATFMRQNAAVAELAMSPVIPRLEAEETAVVDAGSRFVARGGSWKPTPKQEREILRAALDETTCKRL